MTNAKIVQNRIVKIVAIAAIILLAVHLTLLHFYCIPPTRSDEPETGIAYQYLLHRCDEPFFKRSFDMYENYYDRYLDGKLQ